jgi:AcrR family transcriptional regulator
VLTVVMTLLERPGDTAFRYTLRPELTAVKFPSGRGVVHGERVSAPSGSAIGPALASGLPRRRGDKQRRAIVAAVRELLEEKPFAELSVSTISDRAGVARSGFYFYFDSKYAVLAQILGEVAEELEELTGDFAPRGDDETPAQFARRMVGSAAAVYAHNDPVMSACNSARSTDAEIREILDGFNDSVIDQIVPIVEAEIAGGTADPITSDVRGLVRTLSAATALTLSGESLFLGPERDRDRAVQVLEKLWLHALWGGQASG